MFDFDGLVLKPTTNLSEITSLSQDPVLVNDHISTFTLSDGEKSKAHNSSFDNVVSLNPSSTFIFDHYIHLDNIPNAIFLNYFFLITVREFIPTYIFLPKEREVTNHFTTLINRMRPTRALVSCWVANKCRTIPFEYSLHKNSELLGQILLATDSYGLRTNRLLQPNFYDTDCIASKDQKVVKFTSNLDNFLSIRKQFYNQSVLSLVTEPPFNELGIMFTEKTIQAWYAGHFVIWVGGYKAAEYAKKLGFDTFDDIIDHSYQYIEDPVNRSIMSLVLNKDLIFNLTRQKELYVNHYDRIEQNVLLLKDINRLKQNTININDAVMWDKFSNNPHNTLYQQWEKNLFVNEEYTVYTRIS